MAEKSYTSAVSQAPLLGDTIGANFDRAVASYGDQIALAFHGSVPPAGIPTTSRADPVCGASGACRGITDRVPGMDEEQCFVSAPGRIRSPPGASVPVRRIRARTCE